MCFLLPPPPPLPRQRTNVSAVYINTQIGCNADTAVTQTDGYKILSRKRNAQARFEMVRELSAAENNKYLQVADCVLSSVNVIGSYLKESTSLVDTYNPYKVRVSLCVCMCLFCLFLTLALCVCVCVCVCSLASRVRTGAVAGPLNRGHTPRFLSLKPPIPFLKRYGLIIFLTAREKVQPPLLFPL